MSYTLAACLLASFTFFWWSTYGETSKLLAKENACFSAKEFSSGYTFNAPSNGNILGIELVYKSGGVTCYSPLGLTKWGCEGTAPHPGVFMVQMIREGINNNHETIYPTATTNDVTEFSDDVWTCTKCDVARYEMNMYNINSNTLKLIDSTNPVSVTTNELFSLQYFEGCCNGAAHDNIGQTCADVYFVYDRPTNTAVKGSGIFVSELNGDIMIVYNYGMKIYNNPSGNLMVTVSPEIVGTDGDFLYRFPWCNEYQIRMTYDPTANSWSEDACGKAVFTKY